ncbi:hypothetical protein DFJ73DRAFT_304457 [Zopfochytrium polystomum]|nr:hypothetical protein DFJ73DRAFT_304457 [Zopfochytrium polystomum]
MDGPNLPVAATPVAPALASSNVNHSPPPARRLLLPDELVSLILVHGLNESFDAASFTTFWNPLDSIHQLEGARLARLRLVSLAWCRQASVLLFRLARFCIATCPDLHAAFCNSNVRSLFTPSTATFPPQDGAAVGRLPQPRDLVRSLKLMVESRRQSHSQRDQDAVSPVWLGHRRQRLESACSYSSIELRAFSFLQSLHVRGSISTDTIETLTAAVAASASLAQLRILSLRQMVGDEIIAFASLRQLIALLSELHTLELNVSVDFRSAIGEDDIAAAPPVLSRLKNLWYRGGDPRLAEGLFGSPSSMRTLAYLRGEELCQRELDLFGGRVTLLEIVQLKECTWENDCWFESMARSCPIAVLDIDESAGYFQNAHTHSQLSDATLIRCLPHLQRLTHLRLALHPTSNQSATSMQISPATRIALVTRLPRLRCLQLVHFPVHDEELRQLVDSAGAGLTHMVLIAARHGSLITAGTAWRLAERFGTGVHLVCGGDRWHRLSSEAAVAAAGSSKSRTSLGRRRPGEDPLGERGFGFQRAGADVVRFVEEDGGAKAVESRCMTAHPAWDGASSDFGCFELPAFRPYEDVRTWLEGYF